MIRRDDVSPSRKLSSAALTLFLVGLLTFVFRVLAQEQILEQRRVGERQPVGQARRDGECLQHVRRFIRVKEIG